MRNTRVAVAGALALLVWTSPAVTDVDEKAKMAGLLTIRGVQKRVVFDVKYLGQGKDPWATPVPGSTARP